MTPARVFLALGLAFGAAFAVVTPPFDPADEVRHFLRAWLIAEGHFGVVGRAPGYEATLPESLTKLHPREHALPGAAPSKASRWSHDAAELRDLLARPLEPERRRRVRTLSLYSPVAHAPAAAGVALGRLLGLGPAALLYLGRFANLAAWLAIGALALRLAPLRGFALALLALLPMNVFLAGSLSADAPTNALALLHVALVLRCAFGSSARVGVRDGVGLVATSALLGLVKPGYQVLALLVPWIPAARFRRPRERALVSAAALASTALTSLAWAFAVRAADPHPPSPFSDPERQLALVLADPLAMLGRIAATASLQGSLYLRGFVGQLGHLTIPLPEFVYALALLALLAAVIFDGSDPAALSRPRRAAALVLFALGAAGVMLLAYLGWNPPNEPRIHGVQGRYFTPLVPLLLLALPSLRRLPARGPLAFALLAAVCLATALGVTVRAYYFG